MPLSTFEIVTTLTIVSIGAIILLYFIVLKKKGWLTDENSYDQSYLCPNKECRKIFQKPIKVTDLSAKPPRAYLACPNCGFDLETFNPTMPSKFDTREATQTMQAMLPLTTPTAKFKPHTEGEPPRIVPPKPETMEAKPVFQSPFRPMEQPKRQEEEKKLPANPRGCSHFLGYVKTLPKNTPIPTECMWCPMILKCLTGTEKAEA